MWLVALAQYFWAMRPGELLKARWAEVDEANQLIPLTARALALRQVAKGA
jgi:integrase